MAVLPLPGSVGAQVIPGTYSGFAYFNGSVVPFNEANVSVGTHALHYGTGCFEGIRGYWNADHEEIYLIKLREHYERFHKSTGLLKIKVDETVDRLCELSREVIVRSGYRTDVYIRPLAFKASLSNAYDLAATVPSGPAK